ncbi:MAG: CBS domain-containing protein [Burkholderiales bacterium]
MHVPRTCRAITEGQTLVTAIESMLVSEAARLMKKAHVGAILVVESTRLVGVFTERDALFRVVAEGRDPTKTVLAEVMTRNPKSIHPDKPFASALNLMHEGRFRHVPVVEDGRAVGMVSARDAMGPELEDFMYGLIVEAETRRVLA